MTNLEKLEQLKGNGVYLRIRKNIKPEYEGLVDDTLMFKQNSVSTYFYIGRIWNGEFHK